jgi:hypothetical protein
MSLLSNCNCFNNVSTLYEKKPSFDNNMLINHDFSNPLFKIIDVYHDRKSKAKYIKDCKVKIEEKKAKRVRLISPYSKDLIFCGFLRRFFSKLKIDLLGAI